MDGSYYQLLKNGDTYKFNGKKRQKSTRNEVHKAIQGGGGMMIMPKTGSTLVWSGMWSPSDIGKPDCGTSKYELIKEQHVLEEPRVLDKSSVLEEPRVLDKAITTIIPPRKTTVVERPGNSTGAAPGFMNFFMGDSDSEEELGGKDIVGPFKPGEAISKQERDARKEANKTQKRLDEIERQKRSVHKNIGSLEDVTVLLLTISQFKTDFVELRTNFVNVKTQIIDNSFTMRTNNFVDKDRLTYQQNINKKGELSKLPFNGLSNFYKLGIQEGSNSFYRSILACINDNYLELSSDKKVEEFQTLLSSLFTTEYTYQERLGYPFTWAFQTLERQKRGTTYSTLNGLNNQITNKLQDIELVYSFLTVILGINIIILNYNSDKDNDIECRIRYNNPLKPFIVLINLGFHTYEPVFWKDGNKLYKYLTSFDKGFDELNDFFQKQCSGKMSLEDNVSFRVWTQ